MTITQVFVQQLMFVLMADGSKLEIYHGHVLHVPLILILILIILLCLLIIGDFLPPWNTVAITI